MMNLDKYAAYRLVWLLMVVGLLPCVGMAQEEDSLHTADLMDVTISAVKTGLHNGNIQNREVIGRGDLIRAACCNLGESFTNSASVDVSYADPTTGVRQVKLLGLSGTYVQMMTENIPCFRGVGQMYALGFVPGTWMSSIQVSKGASSVKNGYESMTGQINIEYLKPQSMNALHLNAYTNSKLGYEWNADGNMHFKEGSRWSGSFLLHGDQQPMKRDMNGDGFMDEQTGYQFNGMLRLAYISPRYVMQLRTSGILDSHEGGEKAEAGQLGRAPYRVETDNKRLDVHLKNAYIFNPEKDGNIALILSTERQRLDAHYGLTPFKETQVSHYASLMFEEQLGERHGLSMGLSVQGDRFDDGGLTPNETTPGGYAQYTFTQDDRWAVIAGLRADHSSLYGTFVTPRAHVRWHPQSWLTIRAAAGKGYRTPHLYPEMHHLMASSREWVVMGEVCQERSWNTGTSWQMDVPLGGRTLNVNVDYYYTRFLQQMVVDRDADAHKLLFYALPEGGKSFSHCLQVDANYPLLRGLELTAAWRLNYARTTYRDGREREIPLTSRWKGLVTATYKTPLELWQMDVTCQVNGPGRMPDPYKRENGEWSWDAKYKAFPQLSAQVTRFFRWGSVYAGGENLTNFHLKHPIIGADDPFGKEFDSNLVWGPVHGAMGYVGVRVSVE